jgi:pyrroloquinoline quinone biosynthesis protein D
MADKPRLRSGAKLKLDSLSQRWMLVGPERALTLSETAHALVELCDGTRTESDIADALAARFAAPKQKIVGDVEHLLEQLRARCLVEDV